MIFASINERGEKAWQQVIARTKTETRRLKPATVGSYKAVQPNRCEKGIGFIRIKNCEKHTDWMKRTRIFNGFNLRGVFKLAAKREGFKTWDGLLNWFKMKKIDINDTYILSFVYVGDKPKRHQK